MRLDAHQHFWRYEPDAYPWIDAGMGVLKRDFLPDDLRPHLAHHDLDGCLAVQARGCLDETRELLALAAEAPFVRGVVGWVDLRAPDVGDVLDELAADPRLVGVRHIAQDEPDPRWLLRDDVLAGLDALAERDLVYDVLLFPHQLATAVELAARLPQLRCVLDHLGKPPLRTGGLDAWERDLRALAEHPQVCAKVSGLVTEADPARVDAATLSPAIEIALDAFGPTRLLLGSDWPVCLLAASYDDVCVWQDAALLSLDPSERAALRGDNAARVYRIPPPEDVP